MLAIIACLFIPFKLPNFERSRHTEGTQDKSNKSNFDSTKAKLFPENYLQCTFKVSFEPESGRGGGPTKIQPLICNLRLIED